jgi:hypothetical protein
VRSPTPHKIILSQKGTQGASGASAFVSADENNTLTKGSDNGFFAPGPSKPADILDFISAIDAALN